ncbi:MAG: hypothetical protein ABJG47_16065 [Ekhidna sp.]
MKKIIATFLPIVFAVLLALALEALYANRIRQSEIEVALADIGLDIYSYTQQYEAFDFNQSQLDSLIVNIERYRQGNSANFSFGYARPELSSLAWEMSKSTGLASDFGNELYTDIARVYVEYDRLIGLWDFTYDFMLSYDPSMPSYDLAQHKTRQLRRIQARHAELAEKSTEFLNKYNSSSFIKALASPE